MLLASFQKNHKKMCSEYKEGFMMILRKYISPSSQLFISFLNSLLLYFLPFAVTFSNCD